MLFSYNVYYIHKRLLKPTNEILSKYLYILNLMKTKSSQDLLILSDVKRTNKHNLIVFIKLTIYRRIEYCRMHASASRLGNDITKSYLASFAHGNPCEFITPPFYSFTFL
ncbi:hypothetical protein Hanom_Chr13g01214621 [Helianthus anomalus]